MRYRGISVMLLVSTAIGCTFKVEPPDKPMHFVVDLNIKHEILVKVEKEVEQLFDEDKGLF